MNEAEAGLIRELHTACLEEGIGGWARAHEPTLREAYRLTGATTHELWKGRLLERASDHDVATCSDGECLSYQHHHDPDHHEPDMACPSCQTEARRQQIDEVAAVSVPKCGACVVHKAKYPSTAAGPAYMRAYHQMHADG